VPGRKVGVNVLSIRTKNDLCKDFVPTESCVKYEVQEVDGSFASFPKVLAEPLEFQRFVLIGDSIEDVGEHAWATHCVCWRRNRAR